MCGRQVRWRSFVRFLRDELAIRIHPFSLARSAGTGHRCALLSAQIAWQGTDRRRPWCHIVRRLQSALEGFTLRGHHWMIKLERCHYHRVIFFNRVLRIRKPPRRSRLSCHSGGSSASLPGARDTSRCDRRRRGAPRFAAVLPPFLDLYRIV